MSGKLEKIWRNVCALVLTLVMVITSLPASSVYADDTVTPTKAVFYVLNRGYERPSGTSSQRTYKYTKAGEGYIKQTIAISEDDEAVAANIYQEPDVKAMLEDGEKIVWYVCKKEVDGWHIDGEIVKVEDEEETTTEEVATEETTTVWETQEPTTEKETEKVTEPTTEKETEKVTEATTEKETEKVTEATTEKETEKVTEATTQEETTTKALTVAHFAVLKKGYQRPTVTKSEKAAKYVKVGDGKIYEAVKIDENDEAVAKNIAVEPDCSSILEDNEKVVWYVCKKEADGWHIDGEIVTVTEETTTEKATEKETETTTEEPTTKKEPETTTQEPTTKKELETTTEEPTTKKEPETTTEEKTTQEETEPETEPAEETTKETEPETEPAEETTTEKETEKVTEPETTTPEETTTEEETVTKSNEELLREEMYQMLVTGDMTAHDISKYQFTYIQMDKIWSAMVADEGYIAKHTTGCAYITTTRNANNTIKTIKIANMDSDFVNRYNRVLASLDEIKSNITSDMTDLDIIMYVHDYIVEKVTYKETGYISHTAGGVLGDGLAVCQGYADALSVVFHELGIETYTISSTAMNHSWIYVRLDGELYHIDATWDDLKSYKDGIGRLYMLRNDAEYSGGLEHYSWKVYNTTETSTSKKYLNWFVHDVEGKMRYYNGYWYYVDKSTNSLMKAKSDGSESYVVLDGTNLGTMLLSDIEDVVLTYTISSKEYKISLK